MHFLKSLQGSKWAITMSPVSIESTLSLFLLIENFFALKFEQVWQIWCFYLPTRSQFCHCYFCWYCHCVSEKWLFMNILASNNVKNTIEEATVIINYWANKWITELWKLQDEGNYFFCELGIKKLSDQIDKGMQWLKKPDATYKCPCSALLWSRFPTFGLNTERYGVSLRILSKRGKIWARINPNTDTFYAEMFFSLIGFALKKQQFTDILKKIYP